jgi:hypothetical protein
MILRQTSMQVTKNTQKYSKPKTTNILPVNHDFAKQKLEKIMPKDPSVQTKFNLCDILNSQQQRYLIVRVSLFIYLNDRTLLIEIAKPKKSAIHLIISCL